jgi:hypothetical protein
MENKIDIKKEWEAPSIKTLSITMTFGGSGDPENVGAGLGPDSNG